MLKLTLKAQSVATRIELDGQDITRMITGVEIAAHLGRVPTAILYYRGTIDVEGEAGRLVLRRSDSMMPDRVIEATAVDNEYPG